MTVARSHLPAPASLPRFPTGLIAAALALSLGSAAWSAYNVDVQRQDIAGLEAREHRFLELRGTILQLDEVLTMSARMAAATGDPQWEVRYLTFVDPLDAAIQEVMAQPMPGVAEAGRRTDAANRALVTMETRAFDLVHQGRGAEALVMLTGPAYQAQKTAYRDGIDAAFAAMQADLHSQRAAADRQHAAALALAVVAVVVSVGAWLAAVRAIGRWREALRAERAAVAEREERFHLASKATDDLVWDWDLVTGHLWWGDALRTRFGYAEGALAQDIASWTEHIHPEDVDRVGRELDAFLRGRETAFTAEYRFQRADGTWSEVVDRGFAIRDASGQTVRMVGAMSDVTDRRRAEQERAQAQERKWEVARLQALDQAKTAFINHVAHELGTPLTPLRLQVAALRKAAHDPSKVARAAEVLDRNVERLHRLVGRMVEAAQAEAGGLTIDLQPEDVAHLLRSAADRHRDVADRAGVTLVLDAPPGLAAVADARQLGKVLDHLVANALRFTPRGGRVTLTARPAGQAVDIRVADTGVGLTAEQAHRLFQPLTHAHGGTAGDAAGGPGLGLYVSRLIVEHHGGILRAESAGPGQGTTFILTLRQPPAAIRRADAAGEAAATARPVVHGLAPRDP